ncbi:MAG: hypothetical protein MUC36_26975 [Planctomycetes bacterium]|jgi:hypothetical protein|nr:hypothetical protein [Planctomycetota bacterium]
MLIPTIASLLSGFGAGEEPVKIFRVTVPAEMFCLAEVSAGPWGTNYIGAPCQTVSGNPTSPWCWRADEQNCGTISRTELFYRDGADCKPCEFMIEVDFTFSEPCTGLICSSPKCCPTNDWRNGAGESSAAGDVTFDQTYTIECGKSAADISMPIQCTYTFLGYTGPTFTFGYSVGCSTCMD